MKLNFLNLQTLHLGGINARFPEELLFCLVVCCVQHERIAIASYYLQSNFNECNVL